ncbi:MAG: diguanylate cyclase [Acidobacteriota bacterium]|nr:diguanylate cyclase [Acidobacteriota bacterium]
MSINDPSLVHPRRRALWLLVLIVTLIALTIRFLASAFFGPYSVIISTSLFLAEAFMCAFFWRGWNEGADRREGVERDLSSLQSIVEVSLDAIIGVTADGIIMSWNKGARSIYGYSMKEALGTHISLLFDYERAHEAATLFQKVILGENVEQHHTVHLRKEKTPIDVSLTICPIRVGQKITGASVVSRDITERKLAAESLAQQSAAMKASMDGMAIIDHLGACIYLNDAYAKIYGYGDPRSLVGASWESFYLDDELRRIKNLIMPEVWRDGSWRGEVVGRRLDGGTLPLEISISSVAGGGLVQVVRDITERKHAEEKLRNVSLKDELTGLFNRRGLLKKAAPHFDFARRQKEKLFMLFIDLDGMKQINDDFGHGEGDNALLNTAAILRSSFRDTDIIARIGGDEFTVVATDSSVNSEEAVTRLKENLAAYNARKEHAYKLAFSIGVAALEPERMTCFEELLERADRAMYEQKRNKKRGGSATTDKKQQREGGLMTTLASSRGASNLIPLALSASPRLSGESPGSGTFDQAAIGMAVVSVDGSWLQVNDALCALLGYSEQELRATTFQQLTHQNDLRSVQFNVKRVLKGSAVGHQQEKRYVHKQGHTVWVLWNVSLLNDSETGTKKLFFQLQDISDRKKAEERLTQDTLTSLPNRARFNELLRLRVAQTQHNKEQQFAVLFLDVDRFKLVNDSLGTLCGDQLLSQIAHRIRAGLREGDIVGRVGGDEFAILLNHVAGEEEACLGAARIQQELAISFNLLGEEAYATVSIGIALSSAYSEQVPDMLRDAETAMHRAKSLGKARYEIFGRDMHGELMGRVKMETDLRHAIERGQLFIEYQPIMSLDTCKLIGFEALARWRHPESGLISPLDFIPVAEETGQIVAIGKFVLEEACRQARSWQVNHRTDAQLFVSVNLSVKQFTQPGLVEHISRLLTKFKLAPRCLKLEITESVFTENIEAAVQLLKQLRNLGVQMSIDDFGTGYSSLSYLHRFPIDTLKIDRSFVAQMAESEENLEIVRTIVVLAQNLSMDVVAEGVETQDQLALLRRLGCDNGQGFLFSYPLGVDEIDQFIAISNLNRPLSLSAVDAFQARHALVA